MDEYERIAAELERRYGQQEWLYGISADLTSGDVSVAGANQLLRDAGYLGTESALSMTGTSPSVWDTVNSAIRDNDLRIESLVEQAYGIDAESADADFGWRLNDKKRTTFAGLTGGGAGPAPAPYQMQVLPNGDMLVFNPNNGTTTNAGNFPGAVSKQVSQDRDGNLISIDPYSGATEVLVKDFGFPELDPRVKFGVETLMSAAQVEANWAGVDLQYRGLQVQALGEDFARQVSIGTLTLDEAQLNLNRTVAAIEQRRAEREQVLQYGVTRESLRTLPSGEVVTRLPFGAQTAAILSSATGQKVSADEFQLGVTNINPEQAGQDVIAGSAFTSPIPGLIASLQSTKAATDAILASAPQQSSAAADARAMAGV